MSLASFDSRPARTVLRRACAVGLASCVGALLPHTAHAQELRYTLAPAAQQTRWDDALGLDDSFLWGGRAGVVFGRIVELQGFYLTTKGTDARVRDLYARLNIGGTPPQNPRLAVQNYGANLVLNFGTGAIAPFVRGGGSIVRFAPEGGTASDRIALQYGGGLRLGKPGGLRLNVYAENLGFRVDRRLLLALPNTGTAPVTDVDAAKLRTNIAYGAGLTVPLGGAVGYDDAPTSSLSNLSLPVDVFAGRLDFGNSTGLARQYLVGARTGVDFGPLVGLRGFYWRGVNDKFDATQGVQSYGGEAQFNLNAGSGVSPFLVAGAAQIDFRDGFQVPNGAATGAAEDRTALIGGLGVRVPLLDRFIVTLAARDYLTSREGALQDVNRTSQITSNWQYSAGLSLKLGGRTRSSARAPRVDTVFVDRRAGRPAAAPRVAELRRVDTLVVTTAGDTLRGAAADSALGADRSTARRVVVERVGGEAVPAGSRDYTSDRTLQVVVPTEGEINIRYGPARDERRDDRRPEDRPQVDRRAPDREQGRDPVTINVPEPRVYERAPSAGGYVPAPRDPSSVSATSGALTADELRRVVRGAVREELVVERAQQTADRLAATEAAPGRAARVPARGDLRRGVRTERGTPVRKDSTVRSGRTAMAAGVTMADGTTADDAVLEQRITDRVLARVDERLDARIAEQRRAEAADRARPEAGLTADEVRTIVRQEVARATPAPIAPAATVQPRPAPAPSRGTEGVSIYSGVTFTGGARALLGGRLDLGQLTPGLPGFHLIPELGFGFGQATSTYAAANMAYEFGAVPLGPLGHVRPHVAIGAGLLNLSRPVAGRDGLDVVITPAYGITTDLPAIGGLLRSLTVGGRTPELLVEHQGVDFFGVNRLVAGLTYRR